MLGAACSIGLACALALASSPAAAKAKINAKINAKISAKNGTKNGTKLKRNETEHVSKDPFGNIPPGPLQIIISIDQQKLHLYSDGTHVADALVATGVEEHPTPMGVFSVIDKERYHESNIYSGAPMPYMQRITWSGVAMHQGVGVGHRASHGCIRMPEEFAARLWVLHSLGARVIIAGLELKPQEFADARLFVHKERPRAPVPTAEALAAVETVKTAETVDSSKTTDAVAAVAAMPSVPGDAAGPATGKPAAPAADAAKEPPVEAAAEVVPVPLPKPAELVRGAIGEPIAIFVSRKTGKIYVRQHFSPLFKAPITIEHPEQPLGTHVFTALEYLADGSTFRWNVISLPGEPAKATHKPEDEEKSEKSAKAKRHEERAAEPILDPRPPQTPQQALARIDIPQDAIDQISELMASGSSLVVSDQGLGEETGEGTDFIVVTRSYERIAAAEDESSTRSRRRGDIIGRVRKARISRVAADGDRSDRSADSDRRGIQRRNSTTPTAPDAGQTTGYPSLIPQN